MAPPVKRQRRSVVLSSEDDEGEPREVEKEARKSHASKREPGTQRIHPSNIAERALPTRSRTKLARKDSQAATESSTQKCGPRLQAKTSKPISEFFGADRINRQRKPEAKTPDTEREVEHEVEDVIEDDSSDDDVHKHNGVYNSTHSVLDRRKRSLASMSFGDKATFQDEKLLKGSQKFKLADERSCKGSSNVLLKADSRPWVDRFGPDSLEELVVHKKKVSDVRQWLENVVYDRGFKRLLILKGPSGSGKTATISLLSRVLGRELSEWRNPMGSDYSSEGYSSMSAQFEEFLGRSASFGSLQTTSNSLSATHLSGSSTIKEKPNEKIVLLEEFPNTFLGNSNALRSFRSNILEFLVANKSFVGATRSTIQKGNVTPVVMIITETRSNSDYASDESFTASRLLGSDILGHPAVSIIEFNPIAPTLMIRALNLVVQKEARHTGRRRVPGAPVLKHLGEIGDIRNAIGSLEFLCLRRGDDDDWSGRVASRSKKASSNSSAVTAMERQSLEMVTQRESSLGIFHAVGKVVYNKRENIIKSLPQPPNYMSKHFRNRASQVNIENLTDETGTDAGTFVAALHENFVLSCEGASFSDSINDCFNYLSDSDILGSPKGGRYNGNRTSDSLRQEEIIFQLAVRGLLFALPDPVKRLSHPTASKGGPKQDTYKMFYPASTRLSRQIEEIDTLIDQWLQADRARLSQKLITSMDRPQDASSTWQKSASRQVNRSQSQDSQRGSDHYRTILSCTKGELVLERLPYFAQIQTRKPTAIAGELLGRITRFHGIDSGSNEDPDEEDFAAQDAAGQPAGAVLPRIYEQSACQADKETRDCSMALKNGETEKMYLSDDDIED